MKSSINLLVRFVPCLCAPTLPVRVVSDKDEVVKPIEPVDKRRTCQLTIAVTAKVWELILGIAANETMEHNLTEYLVHISSTQIHLFVYTSHDG